MQLYTVRRHKTTRRFPTYECVIFTMSKTRPNQILESRTNSGPRVWLLRYLIFFSALLRYNSICGLLLRECGYFTLFHLRFHRRENNITVAFCFPFEYSYLNNLLAKRTVLLIVSKYSVLIRCCIFLPTCCR